MEGITKDTMVRMNSGELIPVPEYICRELARHTADSMPYETLRLIRQCVEEGATFQELLPYYLQNYPQGKKNRLEALGIDMSVLFEHIHNACVRKILN